MLGAVADAERRVAKAELVAAAAVSSPAPEAEALAHSRKRRRKKTTEVAEDQVSETGAADEPARGKKKCNQKVAAPAAEAAVGALGAAARSSIVDAPGTEAAEFSDLASSSRADALVNASSPVRVLAQTQSR